MAPGELANVSLQVRGAEPVVGSVVATLRHGIERCHAVDLRLLVDLLTCTVPYRLSVAQAGVATLCSR